MLTVQLVLVLQALSISERSGNVVGDDARGFLNLILRHLGGRHGVSVQQAKVDGATDILQHLFDGHSLLQIDVFHGQTELGQLLVELLQDLPYGDDVDPDELTDFPVLVADSHQVLYHNHG